MVLELTLVEILERLFSLNCEKEFDVVIVDVISGPIRLRSLGVNW